MYAPIDDAAPRIAGRPLGGPGVADMKGNVGATRALPPRYRARSGPSEEDRLQKRLARGAKMLHGDAATR
jgi:hypothetical protein